MKNIFSILTACFMFLLFPINNIKAQVIEMGFGLETLGLHRNYTNGHKDFGYLPLTTSVQLHAAVYPIKILAIEGRVGRVLFFDHFQGNEFGIYSKLFPISKFYIIAGISGHLNSGNVEGNTSGGYKTFLRMPTVGFGIIMGKIAGLELLLQKANNNKIGWSSENRLTYTYERVDWLMKLSIQFGWKILEF